MPTTKRFKNAERRAQLLAVGTTVFGRHGFRATSLNAVAAQAGVTKPVLYRHFVNKQAFYDAIAEQEMRELATRVASSLATGTHRAVVESASIAFMKYVEERPEGFSALVSETPISWHRGERVNQLRRQLHSAIVRVFEAQMAAPGAGTVEASVLAYSLVGMWTFVGQWWLTTRNVPAKEVAHLLAAVAWLGVRGFSEYEFRNSDKR